MIHWDKRSREYICDHGWHIAADGRLQLTREQFGNAQYAGMSVLTPGKGTISMPSDTGLMLIRENAHFVIQ